MFNTSFEFLKASSKIFQYGILFVIVLNTLVLAIDNPFLDPETKDALDTLNDIFTWIFVFEVVVKACKHPLLLFV
jgi:hypothetical protein